MPKKGYHHPSRNVICEHCGQLVSTLFLDRALILGGLIEGEGSLDIHIICNRMNLSQKTAKTAINTYRRHLTSLVGKALTCTRDVDNPGRYVYTLTDEWQAEDGPDIQHNEQWFTKGIREHVVTARDMAVIAFENMDGRKRRLKADVGDLVSVLTSVEERIRFMRERLLILDEDLETAS